MVISHGIVILKQDDCEEFTVILSANYIFKHFQTEVFIGNYL